MYMYVYVYIYIDSQSAALGRPPQDTAKTLGQLWGVPNPLLPGDFPPTASRAPQPGHCRPGSIYIDA